MKHFSRIFSKCRYFLQVSALFTVVASASALSEVSRSPASVLVEEDQMVVPLTVKKNAYETFFSYRQENLGSLRGQVQRWQFLDQQAESMGMMRSGLYKEQKDENRLLWLKDNFLRYFQRQAREPFKDYSKTELKRVSRAAGDEIQTIWSGNDEIEASDEIMQDLMFEGGKAKVVKSPAQAPVSNTQQSDSSQQNLYQKVLNAKKEWSFTDKVKIKFKPRVGQGFMMTNLTNPILDISAIMGINGRLEYYFTKEHQDLGLRTSISYDARSKLTIARFDKDLTDQLLLRVSHTRDSLALQRDTAEVRLQFSARF